MFRWPWQKKKIETAEVPVVAPIEILVEKPIEIKKQDRFDLTIYLRSGREVGYNQIHDQNSVDPAEACMFYFYEFYKWYYTRKSPSYTFGHRQGMDIILRDEIVFVKFRRNEIKEDKEKKIGTKNEGI